MLVTPENLLVRNVVFHPRSWRSRACQNRKYFGMLGGHRRCARSHTSRINRTAPHAETAWLSRSVLISLLRHPIHMQVSYENM